MNQAPAYLHLYTFLIITYIVSTTLLIYSALPEGPGFMADKYGGTRAIRNAAVHSQTGKTWGEWFAVLDECDLVKKGHTGTVRHLCDAFQVSPWWAQAVTIRYAWERGIQER